MRDYDLRDCDSAYYFVLEFMNMTRDEYVTEWCLNCVGNFELFWDRNIERIKSVDITNLRIIAFHVLGSLDNCNEIRQNGLKNVQMVLSTNTILSRGLNKIGISFDLSNKALHYEDKEFNIDYDYYLNKSTKTAFEDKLEAVAHRIFYDYCLDGFLFNDDIKDYGTDIHKRPEFLKTLSEAFKKVKALEQYWYNKSKPYKVNFYATINQIQRFTFDLDEINDPPYDNWLELSEDMRIKKWLLSHAIDRAYNGRDELYLYIKDDVIIPPEQIIDIIELDL